MKAGQTAFQADNELYAEASNAAFNICCAWLAGNGYGKAAQKLAEHLNTGELICTPLNPRSSKAPQPAPSAVTARNAAQFGFTGGECTNCGSMAMVRNGNCEKCNDCGTTTGCS